MKQSAIPRWLKERVRAMVLEAVLSLARRLTRRHFIPVDFPTSAANRPRYGYGRPPHPSLRSTLMEQSEAFRSTLLEVASYGDDLRRIDVRARDPLEPSWANDWLPGLDAAAIYSFLRSRDPRHYLEIGSGNSTLFAARAKQDGALQTTITSIDPAPRETVDALCDDLIRGPLETIDLSTFDRLSAGDVVFFDGSHRVFMNSDVTVFFLDVLPRLAADVLVGIHDVYLPDDYPPDIATRFYSEQYILASYLLGGSDGMQPILPATFVSRTPAFTESLRRLWHWAEPEPFEQHGCAFWFVTRSDAPR